MLSPLDYSKRIPRDLRGNLLWRKYVLGRCATEKKYRAAVIEACRDDIFFFILTFVFQVNQNFIPGGVWRECGPFIPVDYQVEAVRVILECIYEREDLLIEKSREMGVSWLCLIVQTWLWNFHKRKKHLCLSRNEEAVDKPDDSDCLFWKVDYILEYLPTWLLQGYDPAVHRRKRSFSHPNGSGWTGQATTASAGVGGRATDAFIDEYPRFPNGGFDVLAGTAATTRSRIFNGTHQGIDTAFYQLSLRPDIRKLVIHWTQHPDKRKGLYRWSTAMRRIESLDPTFEYPPQCSKCLRLAGPVDEGWAPRCKCGVALQDYKFITDGSPLGGPFPGLRSPWYDEECRRIGSPQKVAEELDINPIGSATQAFDAGTITDLIAAYTRPPLWEGDLRYDTMIGEPDKLVARKGGPIKLWIRPDSYGQIPSGVYKIGDDVSNGLGRTPSCASIADAAAGAKVGEIVVAHMDPKTFGVMMTAVARLFHNAEMIWEGAGPGTAFGKTVVDDLNYRNVYWRTIEQKFMPKRRADTPGWAPLPENKDLLLREYGFALASRSFANPSEAALKECLLFKYENGHIVHPLEKGTNDPSGAKFNHGDLAMSDAMVWKLVKESGELRAPKERKKKEPDENSLDGRIRLWERTKHLSENWL